jgi:hypothetical protein
MWYKMVPEIKSRVEGTCTHELVVSVSTTFRPLVVVCQLLVRTGCTTVTYIIHPTPRGGPSALWFEAPTKSQGTSPKMISPPMIR